MNKIEKIISACHYHREKSQSLSVPFIVNDNGTAKISCFTYDEQEFDDRNIVISVGEAFLTDYEKMQLEILKVTAQPDIFPLEIVYDDSVSITRESIDAYYDYLDEIMSNGKIDKEKYKSLFYTICPKSLKPIYDFFGAEFID